MAEATSITGMSVDGELFTVPVESTETDWDELYDKLVAYVDETIGLIADGSY